MKHRTFRNQQAILFSFGRKNYMNIERLLEQFYQATQLPISCFTGKALIAQGAHVQDFNLPLMIVNSLPEPLPAVWCGYTAEHMYFGGITIKENGMMLLIGPVLLCECSTKQAGAILSRIGRTAKDIPALIHAFSSYTVCSVPKLKANLSLLSHLINLEESPEIINITFHWQNYFFNPEQMPVEVDTYLADTYEKELLSYVKYGRITELNNYLNEHVLRTGQEFGPARSLYFDTARLRNYILGANMLISRTAMEAGVDYDLINTLADHYIDLLLTAATATDITYVFIQLLRDYTMRVAQIRKYHFDSSLVQQLVNYMQSHIYEKITPTQMAAHMNMNCSYLCTHFKHITGKTISSFVQELKIEEAKRLLAIHAASSTDIAALLSFSSQSYFCAVFKKMTGITPMEYQKQNQ